MKSELDVLKKKIEDLKERIQPFIKSELLGTLEEIEKILNSVELRKDVTQDYEDVIFTLECEHLIAFYFGDTNIFDDLKTLYESKNEGLLEDVKKLEELSYNLRHGTYKIYKINSDKEKS